MNTKARVPAAGGSASRAVPPRFATHESLLRACSDGRLEGGLSLSLEALPDEVLGVLLRAVGGPALALRVLDVRGPRAGGRLTQLVVRAPAGTEATWRVDGAAALVRRLNTCFDRQADARALALLGEHEGMLQVWSLDKARLAALLEAGALDGAENVRQLRTLRPRSSTPRGAGSRRRSAKALTSGVK